MRSDRQAEIIRRLHCAAGHLEAVIRMAEAGRSCEEVLHQLNAVQSALSAAAIRIIHCQAQSSRDLILSSPSLNERTAELKRLQALYMILTQHFKHTSGVIYD